MAEQLGYDLETFVNKAECALAQQASTSQLCEVGAAGGWGSLWVVVALPEELGLHRETC